MSLASGRSSTSRRVIGVEVREGVDPLLSQDEFTRLLDRALDAAGAPEDVALDLTLSDDAELASLNATHMGKDGPTDVLSFPLLPPSVFPAHAGQDAASPRPPDHADFVGPPGAPVHLGDIIVSVERAIDQAVTGHGGQRNVATWSAADELRLLVVHGALHICGWDHADPVEAAAMRALERQILGLPGADRDP